MTIAQLKKMIAGYHGKAPADYVVNTDMDLLLQAINNARKEAEQVHDFEHAYVFADLVVDEVAGADWTTGAKLHGTDTAVALKTIQTIGKFTTAGAFYPVEWKRGQAFRRDEMEATRRSDSFDADERFPDDGDFESRQLHNNGVIIYGSQLYLKPAGTASTTQTIGIEGQKWFADYTDATADNADIFLQHGYNYLMWAGICEVNYLHRKFASREEGNVPPPLREKQIAFDAFTRWDTYAQSEGSQH